MSALYEVRAEIVKLARLLDRAPDELKALEAVPFLDLRLMRERLTDQLFAAFEERLRRLAAASKLAPVPLIAKMGPMYFRPKLAAAMAGMVEEDRAIKLMDRLPMDYMAEVAMEIDPRQVASIASQVPPEAAIALTEAMISRREYITMGRFIDFVTPELLALALPVIDDVSMLRTAFVAENKARMDEFIGLLPEHRLVSIMYAAASENVWLETLALLQYVSDANRRRLVDLALLQDDYLLNSLVHALAEGGALDVALPFLPQLAPEHLARIRTVSALREPQIAEAVREAAARTGQAPLVDQLLGAAQPTTTPGGATGDPSALLDSVASARDAAQLDGIVSAIDASAMTALFRAAADTDRWADALKLVNGVSGERRRPLADFLAGQDDALLTSLLRTVKRDDAFDDLVRLLSNMGEQSHERVARLSALYTPRMLAGIVDSTHRLGVWDAIAAFLPSLPEHVRERFAHVPALEQPEVIAGLLAAIRDPGELLAVVAALPSAAGEAAASVLPAERLGALIDTAVARNRLGDLLPLVPGLPEDARARIAGELAKLDRTGLRAALADASGAGHLPSMLSVAAEMPAAQRTTAVEILADHADDDDLLGMTMSGEEQQALWTQVFKLAEGSPTELVGRLADRATNLHLEDALPAIMAAAETTGQWANSLVVMSGIQQRAEAAGVTIDFTAPGRLIARAAEQAQALGVLEALGPFGQAFRDELLAGEAGQAVGAVTRQLTDVVEVSWGRVEDGVAPIRSVASGVAGVVEQLPGGKVVTGAAGAAASVAGGLAARLRQGVKDVGERMSGPEKDV